MLAPAESEPEFGLRRGVPAVGLALPCISSAAKFFRLDQGGF
jgi:hypothetical protein